jgi:phenylalanyl-tRNA synthetase beta chain
VEEITRVYGRRNIVPQPLPRIEATVAKPVLTVLQRRTRLAKRTLASAASWRP